MDKGNADWLLVECLIELKDNDEVTALRLDDIELIDNTKAVSMNTAPHQNHRTTEMSNMA